MWVHNNNQPDYLSHTDGRTSAVLNLRDHTLPMFQVGDEYFPSSLQVYTLLMDAYKGNLCLFCSHDTFITQFTRHLARFVDWMSYRFIAMAIINSLIVSLQREGSSQDHN